MRYIRNPVVLALLTALAAALMIVGTYRRFSQTFDEPAHIAAGLEWLSRGTYTYESLHPPVARVAAAIGPYALGERSSSEPDMWIEGNRVLGGGDAYTTRLAAARFGMLPFFIILCAGVFVWARQLANPYAGAWAVVLVCLTPSILAHAGLATTDIALTAFIVWSWLSMDRFVQRPDGLRALLLGTAIGLSLASKISSLAFLASGAIATAVLNVLGAKDSQGRRTLLFQSLRLMPVVGIVAFGVLWSTYRFEVGPLFAPGDLKAEGAIERLAGHDAERSRMLSDIAKAGVWPMPTFLRGIGSVLYEVDNGRSSYLLGEVSRTGYRMFFPIALLVKMPLLHIVLTVSGVGAVLFGSSPSRKLRSTAPLCIALLSLGVLMPSKMTIGLRHALPVLAAFAVFAAVYLASLMEASKAGRRPAWLRPVVVGAFLLQALDVVRAYPDLLAYFNPMAAASKRPIIVDSDLDWGQDVPQLRHALAARGITDVTIVYFGTTDLAAQGLPKHRSLEPGRRADGWVAISETALAANPGYAWLDSVPTFVHVGRSMRLYYVKPQMERVGPSRIVPDGITTAPAAGVP